eukprot:CAMPEP_0178723888 /NCGR_PEP_ID=MMETSP0699-20121125/25801_1 /TAXON_ID=265572 /ORGANISM="Extubocellulus spinifer, Strain CCMP396" /LENGTH=424 /DNA_ID=CAMNT_0020375027 /DNA_START=56 /DNA_END=1330 /DNA_ORIENTATION=+
MSAAAARRRKQLAKKASAEASGGEGTDPVSARLQSLLSDESDKSEETAYEALQLAQSQVRRFVKTGKYDDATQLAYDVSMTLLEKMGRASVASQLLNLLVQVLNETHTECTPEWTARFAKIDAAYRAAVTADATIDAEERERLGRLHLQFLRGVVKWSDNLGTVRYGAQDLHELLGNQCWRMAGAYQEEDSRAAAAAAAAAQQAGGDVDEEDEDASVPWLRCEAVTHLSLAEKPSSIASYLKTLPAPTADELKMGHDCPASERDALLTRSVLVLCAVENLRDANILLRAYIADIESRDVDDLKKSYMDKKDGRAPAHIIFCSMLLRVCEKEIKTGPLYTWLLKSFGSELSTMFKPDVVKAYCTKIGRVYFNIEPPPSMMSTLENMMGMMGGGGGAMGGGGMGGNPMAGMNPAMMQQMMQQMQGM